MNRQPISLSAASLPRASLILNHSLWYATLLDLPLRLHSIRKSHNKAGLHPSDISLIRLLDRICGGDKVEGHLGGDEIRWFGEEGREEVASDHRAEPAGGGTSAPQLLASSLSLLLFPPKRRRSVIEDESDPDGDPGWSTSPPLSPPLSNASLRDGRESLSLTIKGGSTDTGSSPSIDLITSILLPFLQCHFGSNVTVDLYRRGFTSCGGAALSAQITPLHTSQLPLKPFSLLTRGVPKRVVGKVWCSGRKTPSHVLSRMVDQVTSVLSALPISINLTIHRENLSPTQTAKPTTAHIQKEEFGLFLFVETEKGCRLSAEGISQSGKFGPEELGSRVSTALLREIEQGGCIDSTSQACILPWLLLTGSSPPPHRRRDPSLHFTPATRRLSRTPARLRIGEPTEELKMAAEIGWKMTGARVEFKQDEEGWIMECWGIGWTG